MNICKTEQEFIETVAPYAQKACKAYGFYLPSVLIAQAAKELGYAIPSYWDNPGVRGLVEENNMVGIKKELLNKTWVDIGLSVWDGRYLNKKTPEVYGGVPVQIYDDFRIYDNPEQSFADYLCFMRWGGYSVGNPKYYNDIKDVKDYRKLIQIVHQKGYATGPTYSSGVIAIIQKHNLTKYDDLTGVEPTKYVPVNSGLSGAVNTPAANAAADTIVINPNPNFEPKHNTSARSGKIEYIYIHYVGATGDAKANIDYYNQRTTTNASADFYVGHGGDIWQYNMDPEHRYCWAVGGGRQSSHGGEYFGIAKNANGISIEMCVRNKINGRQPANAPSWYFETATVDACVKLTKYLMQKYNIPADHVIRHYDVNGKSCLPIDVTDVLTPNGWVNLGDVKIGDEVAQYIPDTDSIEFAKVLDVVEPREETVLKNRYLEATADHRMFLKPNCGNSPNFKDVLWGDVLNGNKQYVVKNAGYISTDGINLTDDEIRLLVWIQGDGSYMVERRYSKPSVYGIEFHLKKQRKINRVTALLENMGIEFSARPYKNGSMHVRVYGKGLYSWAETWLTDKAFNYNLMYMSQAQFEVFWEELVRVDGSVEGQLYTSVISKNNDIVQAVCALHGKRSSVITMGNTASYRKCTVLTANSNYSVGRGAMTTPVTERRAMVSCVTVPSGYILVRNNDRTFIVGNCPGVVGWNDASGDDSAWKAFKQRISDGTPTVSSPEQSTASTPIPVASGTKYRVQVGAYKKKGNATNKVKSVKSISGLDSFIELEADGMYHVYCGSYTVKANADQRAAMLWDKWRIKAVVEVR